VTFDDQRVDTTGVRDRRGRGGLALGGGAGVLGLVVYLLISLLGGGGAGLQLPLNTDVSGTGETLEQLEARCNTDGAIEKYNDCYLIKVYNEINEVWTATLDGYRQPSLGFFEGGVQTGCGAASSQVGPFYCPHDEEIFIDIGFLQQLQEEFGAVGRYAQAYILAHETGHHLQALLGTERDVRAAQQRSPSRANQLSIQMELQADCYAGVWGKLADERGNVSITERELDQALGAAAAVGDDRIQEKTQGRVDPESWTHGSAEQRRSWYLKGFQSGDLDACDTFESL
jgi:uncharacterized protein